MGIVLVAVGAFIYLRLADSLDDTVDDGLESRADDAAALVRGDGFDLRARSQADDRRGGELRAGLD